MSFKTLAERIKKLEKRLKKIKNQKILGKIFTDKKILEKAKKALFDFDIEKFIKKKDLDSWK